MFFFCFVNSLKLKNDKEPHLINMHIIKYYDFEYRYIYGDCSFIMHHKINCGHPNSINMGDKDINLLISFLKLLIRNAGGINQAVSFLYRVKSS